MNLTRAKGTGGWSVNQRGLPGGGDTDLTHKRWGVILEQGRGPGIGGGQREKRTREGAFPGAVSSSKIPKQRTRGGGNGDRGAGSC